MKKLFSQFIKCKFDTKPKIWSTAVHETLVHGQSPKRHDVAGYAKHLPMTNIAPPPPPASEVDSEASRTIWQWRQSQSTTNPSSQSRKKASIHLVIGAIVASLFFFFDIPRMATVVASISTFTFLLGLLSPNNLFPALQASLQRLGALLALVVTWVSMLPLFFLFFVPFRFLFRQKGKDSMKRFYDPNASTYWKTSSIESNPETTNQRQF